MTVLYRKIHSSIFTSETTRDLSDQAARLAFYLLCGPHSNMIGCYRLPDGYVCEDLFGWSSETVSKGFAELFRKGFATRDSASKWVFIHSFLRWNSLDNPNMAKAAIKLFHQVPDTFDAKPLLAERLCEELARFPGLNLEPFRNRFETLPEPFRNKDSGLRIKDLFDAEKPASKGKGSNGKPKAKTAGEKPKAPRPRNPLFDAIAEVCAADVGVPSVASHVGKICTELAAADPPYSPAEVREFGQSFRELCPWAAKDARQRPELGELAKHIGKVRAAKPGPAADPVDAAKLTRERIERLNVSAPPMFPEPAGGTR